jgi:hypothetical protein
LAAIAGALKTVKHFVFSRGGIGTVACQHENEKCRQPNRGSRG